MPERDMRPVAELIGELFRRKGMKRSLRRAEAVLLWPRVVGADVARFSSARTLSDGVLVVDVNDSETAMHLSLQRRRFLARYHETYSLNDVKEIRFQVGRVARTMREGGSSEVSGAAGGRLNAKRVSDDATGGEATVDPQAVAALARGIEAVSMPEELKAAVLRAGRSFIGMRARQTAAGFSACPTCGALHDGPSLPPTPREQTLLAKHRDHPDLRDRELCLSCRRYAREARVNETARRLALDPGTSDAELSEAERSVARRLACAYLDSVITELLPRAVSQPALKPQFELIARCRAAITVGKRVDDLDDHDLSVLDDRVTRFLGGAWTKP